MLSARVAVALLSPLLLGSFVHSAAPCDRALRRLEGYTIAKVSSIKGTFNGCESGRLLELVDGTLLRCASYGYQYAYMPDAVLFSKSLVVEGKTLMLAKLMVEGELYDVSVGR